MYLVLEFVVILCEKEATTKGNRVGNMYLFQWTSFLLYQIYCISKQKSCLYFYFSCTFPNTTKNLMRTVLSPFCFFSFIAIYIMFLNPHQCDIEIDHSWYIVYPYFCNTAFGKVVSQCGNIRMTTNCNT